MVCTIIKVVLNIIYLINHLANLVLFLNLLPFLKLKLTTSVVFDNIFCECLVRGLTHCIVLKLFGCFVCIPSCFLGVSETIPAKLILISE